MQSLRGVEDPVLPCPPNRCSPQPLRNRQTARVCAPPPLEAPQNLLHLWGNVGRLCGHRRSSSPKDRRYQLRLGRVTQPHRKDTVFRSPSNAGEDSCPRSVVGYTRDGGGLELLRPVSGRPLHYTIEHHPGVELMPYWQACPYDDRGDEGSPSAPPWSMAVVLSAVSRRLLVHGVHELSHFLSLPFGFRVLLLMQPFENGELCGGAFLLRRANVRLG
jgi:hypothetical protein